MRLLLLCCFAVAFVGVYSSDSTDIDEMLSSADGYMNDDSKWNAKFKCLVDQGPCSAVQQRSKDMMKKIDATDCGMCSPKQKEGLKDIRNKLWGKHPKDREQYIKHYNLSPQAFLARSGNN